MIFFISKDQVEVSKTSKIFNCLFEDVKQNCYIVKYLIAKWRRCVSLIRVPRQSKNTTKKF